MIDIKRPTLVVDKQKCLSNISKMAAKAKKSKVIFRPHFKTHQSPEIAAWFRQYDIDKITVSSVEMAELFANHGWNDITIAFPVNYHQLDEINKLAHDIHLNLLVESPESMEFLSQNLNSEAGVFIEIETGYHRSGISPSRIEGLDKMICISQDSPLMSLKGFLTHSGNTYIADNVEDIKIIYSSTLSTLQELKERYQGEFPDLLISIGDTPSCSIMDEFPGADEIRPGNFVYYDIMQYELGVCSLNDIAAVVACPVVAKNNDRNEIIIYGGAIHLSKEKLVLADGSPHFGFVAQINNDGWGKPLPGTKVTTLSQEHGIIQTTPVIYDTIKRGNILGILPVHSCLSSDLLHDNLRVINERY